MKDQILKIAKVKSEKEFYKKYPTEEAFMAKHGKALQKAAMGTAMVDTQLDQLTNFTDYNDMPQGKSGIHINPANKGKFTATKKKTGKSTEELTHSSNPLTRKRAIFAQNAKKWKHADDGWANAANAISGAFTTPGTPGTATTPGTKASGGLGDTLQNLFGGDSSAFGKANPNGAFGKGGVGKGAGNFGKGMAAGAGAAGIGLLNAAPQILEGIGQIGEQKKAIKKADQMSQVSGVTAQAAESRDISKPKNQYVRPEDQMIQGLNPQGSGTNFLAAYGARIGGNSTEIQNTYDPGNLYIDLGYEPLNDSNVKQFAHGGHLTKAEWGEYFQNSGQASIGKGAGSAIGSAFFGPIGGQVGGFLGGLAGNALGGVQDARKLQGFQDTTKANTERAGVQSTAQGIQSTYSSSMKDGGSVVDYMNNKGMNSSFESRKKLYKNIFGEEFSGKAEQNIKLLNSLSNEVKDSPFQKPSSASSNKQRSTKKQTVKDSINAQNATTPFTNPNYPMAPIEKHLESGVIVDKNTNEAYVIKGNKLVKQFPVLTGQSRDGENRNDRGVNYLEAHPEQRVTPTGTYNMRPDKNIYGEPGFDLDPISAYGYPAAQAKSIAEHVTYPGDYARRNPLYSQSGENRTASYGCINCKKPDINALTNKYFPQGDTTMVIDSRNQMDKNVLKNLGIKENGGWVSNDWQPQVIATFGEHKLKDLLQPPHDADMLRAGGHMTYYTPPSARALQTYEDGGWMKRRDGTFVEVPSSTPTDHSPQDFHIITRNQLSSNTTDGKFTQNLKKAIYDKNVTPGYPQDEMFMYNTTANDKSSEFFRKAPEGGTPINHLHETEMRRPFLNLIGKKQLMDRYSNPNENKAQRYLKEMNDFIQEPSSENMEYGGQMAMGGDLEVHRGKAEPISYNPFLQDGGETVMFKGPSHDDGGMPISYGNNGVEVEGGEPAVKLADGGSPDGNLVVFGNMKIDDMAANHIGVKASKGKKYKNFINDLSKFEARQNSVVEKGSNLVNGSNTNDPFDQLAMNSGRLMMMGGNAKLLNAAIIKERAAGVQNAILDTAKEYGIKSDELAQGNFVMDKNSDMAKFGAKMETAAGGFNFRGINNSTDKNSNKKSSSVKSKKDIEKIYNIPNPMYGTDYNLPSGFMPGVSALPAGMGGLKNNVTQAIQQAYPQRAAQPAIDIPFQPGYKAPAFMSEYDKGGNYFDQSGKLVDQSGALPLTFNADQIATGNKDKFDWKGLAEGVTSNLGSLFRPSNQEELDPSQLYPEMFSLASNQLEAVKAQQYNPMLKQSYDISLQDQLNEVDSQVRAATKQIGNNPAAAAQIFAQASDAKNKIRGEQFRMNQANQVGTQNANIDTFNQAQMQNLQLLDQQYGRQAQAKSNTKAQTLEAFKSIASKTAQNKLENRQLGIMENMYNFRFGPNGQAYNANNPYQFNTQGAPFAKTKGGMEFADDVTPLYDASGKIAKLEKKKASRNGSIVKALKTL
jgi:hypothetical protein